MNWKIPGSLAIVFMGAARRVIAWCGSAGVGEIGGCGEVRWWREIRDWGGLGKVVLRELWNCGSSTIRVLVPQFRGV